MSPIDQGKYASYLYYHGLLDKHQYDQLDIIDKRILKMIEGEKWLDAWKSSDDQLNFILTSLNYSNLYDISKARKLYEEVIQEIEDTSPKLIEFLNTNFEKELKQSATLAANAVELKASKSYKKAVAAFQKALEMKMKIFGDEEVPRHDSKMILEGMAECLKHLGNHGQAGQAYGKVAEIMNIENRVIDYVSSKEKAGNAFFDAGLIHEAEAHFRDVFMMIDIDKVISLDKTDVEGNSLSFFTDTNIKRVKTLLEMLSIIYCKQYRWHKASKCCKQTKEMLASLLFCLNKF